MDWPTPYSQAKSVLEFIATVSATIGVLYGLWRAEWEFNFRKTTKHLGATCQDEGKMGYFVANVPSMWSKQWWKSLLPILMQNPTPIPSVPTVSGLIKAGDDGVFTCGMFDCIARNTDDTSVSWKPIYEAFLRECVWATQQWSPKASNLFEPSQRLAGLAEYVKRYKDFAEYDVWRVKKEAEGCKWTSKVSSRNLVISDAMMLTLKRYSSI